MERDEEIVFYNEYDSIAEALAKGKSVAMVYGISTIVRSYEVYLPKVSRSSSAYEGFRAAFRRGRIEQELCDEDDPMHEFPGESEAEEYARQKQTEYSASDEEHHREALLELSRRDPPYPIREE